jgi:hypothetical protein
MKRMDWFLVVVIILELFLLVTKQPVQVVHAAGDRFTVVETKRVSAMQYQVVCDHETGNQFLLAASLPMNDQSGIALAPDGTCK